MLFVVVEKRVAAPLVDLQLLRNQVLVGATLAILIVAGTINALMYVLSLYFQDPAGFGMSALEAGLATLPAAAAMIVITPFITPLAVKIGTRLAIVAGFGAAALGFVVLAFVQSSWTYAAFVVPLSCSRPGSGSRTGRHRRRRPRPCHEDQVGQASGISNMARYIGGSLAVAAVATVFNSVTVEPRRRPVHRRRTRSRPGCRGPRSCSRSARPRDRDRAPDGPPPSAARRRPIDRAAAAAASSHTIPTRPVTT